MGGSGIVDIIIFALIAVFIGLRLRSVLGQRTGHDLSDEEKHAISQRMSGDAPRPQDPQIAPAEDPSRYPTRIRVGLTDILAVEPGFTIAGFLEGAKGAHEMILTAFWSGDREPLNDYLAEDVRESFISAIEAREADGLVVENKLMEQGRAEIDSISVNNGEAEVTVRFTSEIIAITKDADGEVVEGDTSDAIEVIDIWTFARTLGSSDPNWTLVETDAG